MSAKKAGKTRTASPLGKATRFPRTATALRGAPPTAADDERSPGEATAPEAASASAPPEPAAARMEETAAVGVQADGAVAVADLAAAAMAPASAILAGLALDALTPEPPAAAAAVAALSPAPAESAAETERPDNQASDAATAADGPAARDTAPELAATEGTATTATLAAPAEGEGVAAAPAAVPGRTAKAAAPGRRGRRRTPQAPAGRVDGAARRPSALDAAARVLAEAGRALTCPEMIAAMAARGYWASPGGLTPAATLYSALLREITSKGAQARFRKAGRGQFALAAAG
jgi:HB1, ASXL, restriction endonuclease HTH domain